MMLEIDDSQTVADIQDKFSRCFPHLKVEFCRKKHHWEALCSNKDLFSPQLPIGLIRKIHDPGIMEIKSWQKIGEVERKFKDLFGLNAQIYFRSSGRWIQTTNPGAIGKEHYFIWDTQRLKYLGQQLLVVLVVLYNNDLS